MIAVDANGADQGPGAVAEGARRSGHEVLLFGPAAEVGPSAGKVEVVDAPLTIGSGEEPAQAVRSTPDASIVQAARAVADGRAEALVSAGSTGPTLAAATLQVKRIRGVHRPALAVLLPIPGGPVLLLDAGASVEVRPEHLVQFAYMGSCFMEAVYGLERPRVGLLSVGEESGKGTPDVLAAHRRIVEAGGLEFVGNVEGFDLPGARADVVVTDGFTGNVALKVLEGTSRLVRESIRDAVTSGPVSAVGGLLIRGRVNRLRERLDPEGVGGAILLGLRKPVVVAHGSFGPKGIASAIGLARRAVDEDMVDRTAAALRDAGALRSAAAGSVAPVTQESTASGSGEPAMERAEVLQRIRDHLSTELEVDPARIAEDTRFKEDLEADSLDLVELVVELEDSYGIRIPDEEAAGILTVGQAADFVAAHAAEA